MIGHPFKKIKFLPVFLIYVCILQNPLIAIEPIDYSIIDKQVRSCYKEIKFCNKALYKINYYQNNAAKNKKFSCQTRLLGLEANLIMAMNFNFKRKEARSIINAIRKYC